MFNVGDKVVYPMHGAGIIEAVEEREVLGETRNYYVLKMPIGSMKVMVPIDSVKELGLREVIDPKEVDQVFNVLKEKKTSMSHNWNRRYRANMEKIKSGNVFEVAEVVKNLNLRDREKGLSTGERKMLENARQILISELVLVNDSEEEHIQNQLEGVLTY